jgi:hypothetical protein
MNYVLGRLGVKAQQLPAGTILYNMDVSSMLRDSVELEFEPLQIRASESLRRADIEWGEKTSDNWIRITEKLDQRNNRPRNQFEERLRQQLHELTLRDDARGRRSGIRGSRLWLASPNVPFYGNDNSCGISSYYRTFLRGDIAITKYLRELASTANDDDVWRRLLVFTTIFESVADYRGDRTNLAASRLRRIGADLGEELTQGSDQFLEALTGSPLGLFDTSVWSNRLSSWIQ